MTHYISRENNKLVFKTNSLDRLTIENDGNVGIGTTTPSRKLEVNGDIVSSGITCTGDITINGNFYNNIPEVVYARKAGGSDVTSDGVLVYNYCDVNTSNSYNTSTGIYTCPTDGYYYVNSHGLFGSGNSWLYVRKNGTKIGSGTHCNTNNTWNTMILSIIIQCSAGDTIDIYFDYTSAKMFARYTTETDNNHALNSFNIKRL